jgi:hypothetical protein
MTIHPYQWAQIAALLTALYCNKGIKRQNLGLFIPLLCLIIAAEGIANNYKAFGWSRNHFVYNYYLLLSTPLYLLLYANMLRLHGLPRTIFIGMTALLEALLILNFFFIQGTSLFNTYSLILIMVATIILSCFVLLSLAADEENHASFFRLPLFWINAAYLLFSLVTLVLLGLQQYILARKIELDKKSLYFAILPGINILLYIVLAYAFLLCRTQNRKYSSSSLPS